MNKNNFLFEIVLMSVSAIMMLILFMNPGTFLFFIGWQGLVGIMQFIHALILTYKFKKDLSIWAALRTYWIIAGLVFMGLLLRNEQWFPTQASMFVIYVLPWFNAIYLTMLTYRYSKMKTVINCAVKI